MYDVPSYTRKGVTDARVDLQLWETINGFNFRHGETHTDPFHPFDHPLTDWRHYSPSNRENYFGQACAQLANVLTD